MLHNASLFQIRSYFIFFSIIRSQRNQCFICFRFACSKIARLLFSKQLLSQLKDNHLLFCLVLFCYPPPPPLKYIDMFIIFFLFGFISSYYELDDTDYSSINRYLSELVEKCVYDLSQSYCIGINEVNPFEMWNCSLFYN